MTQSSCSESFAGADFTDEVSFICTSVDPVFAFLPGRLLIALRWHFAVIGAGSSTWSSSPSSTSSTDAKDQQTIRPNGRRGIYEHTPPPSPTDGTAAPKIDIEGINDDIVVGVIEQLEKTGNRPHLVKELAAILVTLNENVAKYAIP